MFKETANIITYNLIYDFENMKKSFIKARRRNCFIGADGEDCKKIQNIDKYIENLIYILKEKRYVRKPMKYQKIISWDGLKTHIVEMESFSDRVIEYAIQRCLETKFNSYRMPFVCNAGNKGERKYNIYINKIKNKGCKYFVSYDVKKFTSSVDREILIKKMQQFCDKEFIEFVKYILFRKEEKGLPPGHILTTYLANFYLYSVDIALNDYDVVRIGDNYLFGIKNLYEKEKIDIQLTDELKKIKMTFNPDKITILLATDEVRKF